MKKLTTMVCAMLLGAFLNLVYAQSGTEVSTDTKRNEVITKKDKNTSDGTSSGSTSGSTDKGSTYDTTTSTMTDNGTGMGPGHY